LIGNAATYPSAGIAFCFMTQSGRYAKIVKKEVKDYRIIQDTHFVPGAFGPVETHVFLATDHDDMFARTILDMSEQTCFLHALCRTRVQALHLRCSLRTGTAFTALAPGP
jgi:hypothetical protein